MTFSDLWEQFTYHCRVKRRSENTLAFYGTTANAFTIFIEQQKLESLETLTVHHLRAYMRELETKGLGPGGLHSGVRALNQLLGIVRALHRVLIKLASQGETLHFDETFWQIRPPCV